MLTYNTWMKLLEIQSFRSSVDMGVLKELVLMSAEESCSSRIDGFAIENGGRAGKEQFPSSFLPLGCRQSCGYMEGEPSCFRQSNQGNPSQACPAVCVLVGSRCSQVGDQDYNPAQWFVPVGLSFQFDTI